MEQKSIQVNRSPDLTTAQVILNEQSSIVIVYFLRSIFTELCFTNLVQPSWRRVVQREREEEWKAPRDNMEAYYQAPLFSLLKSS